MDALEAGRRDIYLAAFLPHSPLRVYVMGQRGVDREPATPEDLSQMRKLAAEAIDVGALGFASSRLTIHKTESGQPIPSYDAGHDEIEAIASPLEEAGRRPCRPRSNRGGIQGSSERRRPRRTASAQADRALRPACGRASSRPGSCVAAGPRRRAHDVPRSVGAKLRPDIR